MNKKNGLTAILLLCVFSTPYAQADTMFTYRKPLFDFKYDKPVFKLESEQLENPSRLTRFTALTGYREGVRPTGGVTSWAVTNDEVNGTQRFFWINLSIQDILIMFPAKNNRIILEVKDPSRYRYEPKYGDKEAWMRKNAYCLEVMLPLSVNASSRDPLSFLQREVSYVFGAKVEREIRMIDALVLVRTSSEDKLKSVEQGDMLNGKDGKFKNVSLDLLGEHLSNAGLPAFVNETSYQGLVDMDLGAINYGDLAAVRKALQKYDLDIKQEKREMEVYIIKENNQ